MLDEFKGFVRGLVEGALKPDRVRLGPTRLAYVSGGVLAAMEAWLGSGCRKDVAVLVSEIEDATSAILGE